jgi:hypothetical protein
MQQHHQDLTFLRIGPPMRAWHDAHTYTASCAQPSWPTRQEHSRRSCGPRTLWFGDRVAFCLAPQDCLALHHKHTAPCLAPHTHIALPCTTYTHRLALRRIHTYTRLAPQTHSALHHTHSALHHRHTSPCTTVTQRLAPQTHIALHHTHTVPCTTVTVPCATKMSVHVRLPCHALLLFVWCARQRGNTFCRAGFASALSSLVHAHAR